MRLTRVEGRDDGGRPLMDLRLPGGLVALLNEDPAERAALVQLFAWGLGLRPGPPSGWRAGSGVLDLLVTVRGRSVRLRSRWSVSRRRTVRRGRLPFRVALPREDLDAVWSGMALPPERLLGAGAALLAGVGRAPVPPPAGAARVRERRPEARSPELLRRAEIELRSLRADAAEAAGDLEVATMDWLRERQDAETHLMAYRDRARELKARIGEIEAAGPGAPCPTCGRVLGDRLGEVVSALREEWESVVQDGRWWKRRREQLELKPRELQDLEGRVVRLQAAVADLGTRTERFRAGTWRPETSRARLRAGAEVQAPDAARLAAARMRLLDRAGGHVNRISGGSLVGLAWRDGRVLPTEAGAPADPDRPALSAAVGLAIRLSAVEEAAQSGILPEGFLLVGDELALLDHDWRLRALTRLHDVVGTVAQVIVVAEHETLEPAAELLGAALDATTTSAGAWRLRSLPCGVPGIRLVQATGGSR